MTSPKIRATRRCAASCCGRIEIVPSRHIALAWLIWIGLCCLVLMFGISLPWSLGLAFSVGLVVSNLRALERHVYLRGTAAVRALEWNVAGEFRLWLGDASGSSPARLEAASFRLGLPVLALWFTTPEGVRAVLVDGRAQEPAAFRRLCRVINRRPYAVTGIDSRGS